MNILQNLAGATLALTLCAAGPVLAGHRDSDDHGYFDGRDSSSRHADRRYDRDDDQHSRHGREYFRDSSGAVYSRHGDTVYESSASGDVYQRHGDSVYHRSASGAVYQRNGDTEYSRDASGAIYQRDGNRVYERDASGATRVYYLR